MSSVYIPKDKKSSRLYKAGKSFTSTIQNQTPLSKSNQEVYKTHKQFMSDYRESRRADNQASKRINKLGISNGNAGATARFTVTSDNRPEVYKGSSASGVTVNNKLVRKGRVQAAENMVRASKRAAALDTAGRALGALGIAAQAAATGYAIGSRIKELSSRANAKRTQTQGMNQLNARLLNKKLKKSKSK